MYIYAFMSFMIFFLEIARDRFTWLIQFFMSCYHNDKNSVYVYMYIIDKYMILINWAYALPIDAISNAHYLWRSTLEPLIWSKV